MDALSQAPLRPVEGGRVSGTYGEPREGGRRHNGIDFAVPEGTLVRAARAGVAVVCGWQNPGNPSEGFGLRVWVDNGGGSFSCYAHLSRIDVAAGDRVEAGAAIGLSGNTGRTTGPHLHYEERLGAWGQAGTPRDPGFRVGDRVS